MSNKRLSLLIAALALLLVLAGFATPATAHAFLADSDPANGAQLDDAPEEIELSYSGDGIVEAEIEIVGPEGDDVSGAASIGGANNQEVTIPVEDDGEGIYVVEWEVLADDGHTTSGTIFFSVGDEQVDREMLLETQEGSVDDDISWFEAGAKGLLLVALAGVVGAPLVLGVAVFPALSRRGIDEETVEQFEFRSLLLLGGLVGILAISLVGMGISQTLALGSLDPSTIVSYLGTSLGFVWLLQFAAVCWLVAILGMSIREREPPGIAFGTSAFVGLVVAAGIAWTSHSATAIDRLVGFTIGFVHLVGAALWVGGLLALAAILPALLDRVPESDRRSIAATIIRRYSALAVAGVGALLATGLFLASWHANSADALLDTQYGLILVTKLVLIAVALGLGGYHRFVVLRRLDARPSIVSRLLGRQPVTDGGQPTTQLKQTVRIELLVLVVVLLLSGVLTSGATATVVLGETDTSETIELAFDEQENIDAIVELQPVIDNESNSEITVEAEQPFVLDATFERDGETVHPAEQIELRATSRETGTNLDLDMERDGSRYSAVEVLPDPGEWELRVVGDPAGVFGSVSFDVIVQDETEDEEDESEGHVHGSGPDLSSDDDADHDHGETGGLLDDPLRIAGLVVGLYGLFAVVFEGHLLSRRQR